MPSSRSRSSGPAAAAAALALALAGGAAAEGLTPLERVGRSLFGDPMLSVSGDQPCMFCHHPGQGFTAPHAWVNAGPAVVPGAVPGRHGNRKPPTVAYAAFVPPLHRDAAGVWRGGLFLDGRATGEETGLPLADQAAGPLLNPVEMALPDPACAVLAACRPEAPGDYPVPFASLAPGLCDIAFPPDLPALCRDPGARIALGPAEAAGVARAFALLRRALAAWQASAEVNRFASRLDRHLAGEAAALSAEERAGLELFAGRAGCAACHALAVPPGLPGPLLTDFSFVNLGLPRNPENPWYRAPENPEGAAWADPGLGGHLAAVPGLAALAPAERGRFRVPTLRNVAARLRPELPRAYGHNGYFRSLAGIVTFHATRDAWPRCPGEAGEAEALAARCWPAPEVPETVERERTGDLALTEAEIAALVAFLGALSDEPPLSIRP